MEGTKFSKTSSKVWNYVTIIISIYYTFITDYDFDSSSFKIHQNSRENKNIVREKDYKIIELETL